MTNRPRRTTCRRSLSVVALTSALILSACAAPDEGDRATDQGSPSPTVSPDPSPTNTPRPSRTARASPEEPEVGLEVTVAGGDVGPNAQEIELGVGEPLVISFDVDRSGELHVHSKPEQYVQFPSGTSTQELVIETPGLVEVEEHDTGAVVAVVEVR